MVWKMDWPVKKHSNIKGVNKNENAEHYEQWLLLAKLLSLS